MKRSVAAVLSAAGILGLAGLMQPAAAQRTDPCAGPIVLGTTISATGTNSTLSDKWMKLTQTFEEEFNKQAGGVKLSACGDKKVPLKFVMYDDQSVPATAVSLYEKMATVDKVDLFVGPDWSTHGFPVSQIFEKYKTPSVMSNVATPKVYEQGFKYIAGIALDAATWSQAYFNMLDTVNPKPKTVFFVVHDNLIAKTVFDIHKKVAQQKGMKVVGEETFAPTTKDFTGVILKMKAAKPDVIYISSFDAVSVPLMQQMRQLKVTAMDVHHIMATGAMAKQVNLEGVTGEVYWHEGIKGPYSEIAVAALHKADVNLFDYLWTGARLDAYFTMIQAIERAGKVDREMVAQELRKPGAVWQRPGGPFKLSEGGLSEIVSFTHQIQKGVPVIVWPKEQANGQLIWPSPTWQ